MFIDIFDIKSGDRIEDKVHAGLNACNELISLLTPWSVDRNWVWTEMASVWILKKRYVGVLYRVTLEEIDKTHGGLAVLSPTNVISINTLNGYFEELSDRVKEASNA